MTNKIKRKEDSYLSSVCLCYCFCTSLKKQFIIKLQSQNRPSKTLVVNSLVFNFIRQIH